MFTWFELVSLPRLLILSTALTCVGCGSGNEPIHPDDPEAVIALKKAGANVEFKPTMAAKDMKGWGVNLADTSLGADLFEHMGHVEGLMEITLKDSDVTDEILAQLPEIRSVQRLDLTGSSVTDEGLKHVSKLSSLITLNLSDTKVTGPGLADLAPNLGALLLNNLPIDDSDLKHLNHLNRLTLISLTGTEVTPEGLREFKKGRPGMWTVGIKMD